jgi:56kDa selenium binding protein (SBP56)
MTLVVAAIVAVVMVSVSAAQLRGSRYLFVWAGDADGREADFLAVVDVDPQSATYRSVITTRPVDARGTRPHHTEYEMPADGILWANGFAAGRTFLFDLRHPVRPTIVEAFDARGAFSHPHSYARLPNGHVLATFQQRAAAGDPPADHADHAAQESKGATGGLVEFDQRGHIVRSASAAIPAIDPDIRPYSIAVLPSRDRVVTTSSDMHLQVRSRAIQIWRLSDLSLLQTLLLPAGPRGDENFLTAEPRVLDDGKTVLVNTFTCGLYKVNWLDGQDASVDWIYSSPWKESTQKRFCAVPAVAGRFWIQTSGFEHAVITLDVSDPAHPHEVSRLTLGADEIPHWIALEPDGHRAVITGYEALESRVLLARLDRVTGRLTLDGEPVDFGREQWPHGPSGRAIPHGAVFSRP